MLERKNCIATESQSLVKQHQDGDAPKLDQQQDDDAPKAYQNQESNASKADEHQDSDGAKADINFLEREDLLPPLSSILAVKTAGTAPKESGECSSLFSDFLMSATSEKAAKVSIATKVDPLTETKVFHKQDFVSPLERREKNASRLSKGENEEKDGEREE